MLARLGNAVIRRMRCLPILLQARRSSMGAHVVWSTVKPRDGAGLIWIDGIDVVTSAGRHLRGGAHHMRGGGRVPPRDGQGGHRARDQAHARCRRQVPRVGPVSNAWPRPGVGAGAPTLLRNQMWQQAPAACKRVVAKMRLITSDALMAVGPTPPRRWPRCRTRCAKVSSHSTCQ